MNRLRRAAQRLLDLAAGIAGRARFDRPDARRVKEGLRAFATGRAQRRQEALRKGVVTYV